MITAIELRSWEEKLYNDERTSLSLLSLAKGTRVREESPQALYS